MDREAESTNRGSICRCRRLPCDAQERSAKAGSVNFRATMVGQGRGSFGPGLRCHQYFHQLTKPVPMDVPALRE
jgi:hypothetical protein